MKILKYKRLTICFITAFVLLSFFGCVGQNGDISSNTENSEISVVIESEETEYSEPDSAHRVIIDDAARSLSELLDLDRLLTDIFVNNSLLDEFDYGQGDIYIPFEVDTLSEYRDYSALIDMINQTYAEEASAAALQRHPSFGPDTVGENNGVTTLTRHYTARFDNYIDQTKNYKYSYNEPENTVSVSAVTIGGDKFTFDLAKNTSGEWKLASPLYFIIKEAEKIAAVWEENEFFNTIMNSGSAKSLRGDNLIINIFVSDEESSWNKTQKESVLEMLETGTKFLMAQAEQSDVELQLDYTNYDSSPNLEFVKEIPVDYMDFGWTTEYFADTIYGDLNGFISETVDIGGYDNYAVILHINKQGRSYALQSQTNDPVRDIYYAERCVMYYTDDETFQYRQNESMYIHELLHLFGADDLYIPYVTDELDERLVNYCFNEIMRYVNADIEQTMLSPFTRFRIGWQAYVEDEFLVFFEAVG